MKAITCKCKNCGVRFIPKRSSLESSCSPKCAIENEQKKFLIKGTPAFKAAKVEVKIGETRNELQKKINMLARMIDAKYGFVTCIDCNLPMNKQIHGAHFHQVKGNEQLRFNLHNIHSALSQCNKYSSEHKVGYILGLQKRYGYDYYLFVDELPRKYINIHLNAVELKEKLKIVNKLIRDFETYQTTNAINARGIFNKIIQIYEK